MRRPCAYGRQGRQAAGGTEDGTGREWYRRTDGRPVPWRPASQHATPRHSLARLLIQPTVTAAAPGGGRARRRRAERFAICQTHTHTHSRTARPSRRRRVRRVSLLLLRRYASECEPYAEFPRRNHVIVCCDSWRHAQR